MKPFGRTASSDETKRFGWIIWRICSGQIPIDNILSHIKGVFPRTAKEFNVELIVQKVHYQSRAVEIVDVTDRLVLVFEPDEETLKAIESFKKQLSPGTPRMPSNHPPVNNK